MDKIFLVQTDTTVGFLSKNLQRLNLAKKRNLHTPCIKSVGKYKDLLLHVRVPNKFKNFVRKSKKTTFIYPNKESARVVKTPPHRDFLIKHGWMYSTSANETGGNFDEKYAREVADEVCEDERGFFQSSPSRIIQLGRIRRKKVRI